MRKLITFILAILMSLIPTMTGTQPTAPQIEISETPVDIESAYEPTVDIETEQIVTVIAESESIATEPLVATVDAPCAEVTTEPDEVPDTVELPAKSDQSATYGSDEAVETTVTDMPEATIPWAIDVPEEMSSGVSCVDGGSNDLAPYTHADGRGTPNPFENAAPHEVTEIDAEDLIQPGEDIHF